MKNATKQAFKKKGNHAQQAQNQQTPTQFIQQFQQPQQQTGQAGPGPSFQAYQGVHIQSVTEDFYAAYV